MSKFLNMINVPVFIVSLALGLFCVYVTVPAMKVIYVYPTPDNIKDIQYIDKANNCHTFSANEIDCDGTKNIKDIPVQK